MGTETKRLALLCAALCFAVGMNAWDCRLSRERNMPRDGDALNRALITSGQEGTLVEDGDAPLWDFSRAKYAPCRHRVRYYYGKDGMLYRAQGREQLVFSVCGDTLWLCRHLKPSQRLVYTRPIPLISLDFKENDQLVGCYYALGSSDGTGLTRKQGFSSSEALPPSRLVTPDNDTLEYVLEVRNCRFGAMEISPYTDQTVHDGEAPCDSLISVHLQNDSISYHAETSYWYAAGYRYPIIERDNLKVYNRGQLVDSVCLAYYYSPRTQAAELDDEANDTLRTYLADNPAAPRPKAKGRHGGGMSGVASLGVGQDGPSASLSPTVTDRAATFAVSSPQGGSLAIGVYSMNGRLVSMANHTLGAGGGSVPIDVSGLPVGTYLVTGTINGRVFPFKLIKR